MAAGWLGKLQAHFGRRTDCLAASEFLARHDSEFFKLKAELALRDVARISAPLASRLAGVLVHYDRLVDLLTGQPRTLVHGAYRPCNILTVVASDPVRICPVDWEAAAIGSPFYDLAYLTNGFEPPILERFLDAYRHEALGNGVAVPDREEARHLVDVFRFSMTINLLSRAHERGFSVRRVAKAIDLLEQLHGLIRGRQTSVQG
jgi:thiamine kinase-like enzyme